MNLIAKRLYSQAVGNNIEIMLSDGTKYAGVVTEKDEECIAISDGKSELIVTYECVKVVKISISSEKSVVTPTKPADSSFNDVAVTSEQPVVVPVEATENSSNDIAVTSEETVVASVEPTENFLNNIAMTSEQLSVTPTDLEDASLDTESELEESVSQDSDSDTTEKEIKINESVDMHELKFITSVFNKRVPDVLIRQAFEELPKKEKKKLNGIFSSFTYAIKNNESSKCNSAVNNMKSAIELEGDLVFSTNAYKLLAYMFSRCNIYDVDLYIKGCCYDYAAIALYVSGSYKLAAAYASMSLSTCDNPDLADQVYTIIAKTLFSINDAGAVINAIQKNPSVINDKRMTELLKFIYKTYGMNFSASVNTVDIITTLKRIMPSEKISAVILSVDKSTDVYNDCDSDSDFMTGEIVKLSWSSDKGTIESDDKIYKFSYSDVIDKKLHSDLEQLFVRDLKANNLTFPVRFEAKDDHAYNIVSCEDSNKTTVSKKTVSSQKSYSAVVDNIQLGRQINIDKTNEDRFYDSLKYFERAIENGDRLNEAIPEAINCCLAISNKEGTADYLERAYNIYQDNKQNIEKHNIKLNVVLLDLFTRLDNTEECMAYLDRILEDSSLKNTTRMQYINRRAELLFNQALSSDDTALYEKAKNECRSWEKLYYSDANIYTKQSFTSHYYTVVLYRIAVCLYKTGDNYNAECAIASILKFDPDNENAKKLLAENSPSYTVEDNKETVPVEEKAMPVKEAVSVEDYTDEELLQPCEYIDTSGWDSLNLTEEDVIDYTLNIKGTNRLPLALTYLKAASMLNSNFIPLYTEMSLATDNPMETLNYSLNDIFTRFGTGNPYAERLSKFCFVAAYMRGSFYYTSDKEYFSGLEYLYDSSLDILPSLKKTLEMIDGFRVDTGRGIDYYADYRAVNLKEYESRHQSILEEASTLYEKYFLRTFHEQKNQLRFKLTKSIIFEKGGLPERMLSCVVNDNYQEFELLKDEFCKSFIRNGMAISSSNIQSEKIDAVIDEAWKKAGEDKNVCAIKSSDLMGSFRNNIRSPLNNCVKIVCDWVELCESGVQNRKDNNFNKYQKTKNELIPLLNNIIQECSEQSIDADNQTDFGCCILSNLALELISRLDGSWTITKRKYFFHDFLRTDYVILNEKFIPDVYSTFCDLPEFNILQRIRNHIDSTGDTLVKHARKIYQREEENHDYGTARLIAEYLAYQGREGEWQLPDNAEEFEEQAKKQLRACFDNFNSDVAMAVSRGQIDVSDKFMNSIEETAQYWYQYCVATKNYGFFTKFVDNCTEKMHNDAAAYGKTLFAQLSQLANEEKAEQDIIDKITALIDKQYFTVAEDFIARILNGDFDSREKAPIDVAECLNEFWNEFEENYNLVQSSDYTLKRVIHNSNSSAKYHNNGGEALIDNWLDNANKSNSEKISILLNLLGWENIEVTDKSADSKYEMYLVKDKSSICEEKLYPHPIPAFSSQSYDTGFYVVCLYGYMDSERLLNKYNELDEINGNKIILLDYALSSAERRNIARLIKQTSLQSTYIFIDRVSIIYLANHYISGDNNKTLMAISMPFSYLQPYVSESSLTIPSEMFVGRHNELASIESPTGANFVFGAAQLGKSALLKKAVQETDNREVGKIALLIDIAGLDIEKSALKVSKELISNKIILEDEETNDLEKLTASIKSGIIRNSITYLLILLDEADTFIDNCKNINYQPLVLLNDIQQSMDEKFKFVMAGRHNVVELDRIVALDGESVITRFPSINVKPFNYEEGRELLTKPLGYLGFIFDDELLVDHVLTITNYFPGLIRLYCVKLLESMRKNYAGYNESTTPPYHITENHIGRLLADKSFVSEIKNTFELTLNLKAEYYIISLTLADLFATEEKSDGYSVNQITELSVELGVDNLKNFTNEQLEALLDELCDLNILKKFGECYSFRTKSLRDLLGSKQEIEEKLLELMNKNEKV